MVVLVLGAAGAYTSVARATPSRASDCSSSDAVSGSISVSGGTATGSFTVAAGCSGVEVSLVSYQAPRGSFDESIADRQVRYREVTESFDAGRHTLAVDVPDCYFQVDLVTGAPIEKLGPSGSDNFYGAQGRLVDAANGGSASCQSPPPPSCPSTGAVTDAGPISVTGDTATVTFTVGAGCSDVEVSLVSYKAPSAAYSDESALQQTLYKFVTATVSGGTHTLSVGVPSCYYQVDFVYGLPITTFGGSEYYYKQGRMIESVTGGTSACTTPPPVEQPPVQQPPPAEQPAPVQQPAPVVQPIQPAQPVVAPAATPPVTSGVAGVHKTIVHKKAHKKAKAKKVKRVKKRAKPAKAVVRAAKFTG
jgi:hypothetical protein